MVLWIIVIAAVLISLRFGFLSLVIYVPRAWRRGCAIPHLRPSVPIGLPRVFHMLRIFKSRTVMEETLRQSAISPNTRYAQNLLRWVLITNDPENIKTVLSTKFKDYSLGLREQFLGAFGSGIFTLSGQGWKHSRNMLRPQFTRDQISQLGSVNAHADKLFEAVSLMQSTSQYIDAQFLFHQFTIDTATDFLFGESLNTLNEITGGVPVAVTHNGRTVTAAEFVESYQIMVRGSSKRIIFGPLYWLADTKEFKYHIERAQVVVDSFVAKALKMRKTSEIKADSYVFSHALARETCDPIVIRDQIFNILIAGRDTTAVTMTFIAFYMAKYPKVYQHLRQTIIEDFGTEEDKRDVTFEMLRGAKYLNAVINEVLRLCPVVPLNQRTAIRDTTLPRGGGKNGDKPVFVPKGTSVSYQCVYLHRDKSIWGKDADEFKPERWLKKQDIPSWAYIPFNGGPRICLGQQFALTELALMYVRIAQRYSKITLGPGQGKDPAFDISLTIKSRTPVDVRFIEK